MVPGDLWDSKVKMLKLFNSADRMDAISSVRNLKKNYAKSKLYWGPKILNIKKSLKF